MKWLDIQRQAKLVVRTKNPAPNPAVSHIPHSHSHSHGHLHSSSSHLHPSSSSHLNSSSHLHPTTAHLHTSPSSSHLHSSSSSHSQSSSQRFNSPSLVYGGKKIDLKNFDIVAMQKTSVCYQYCIIYYQYSYFIFQAILVEAVLPPTTIEITKDDYDILMELIKLFSSDEESPMTNIDVSCSDCTNLFLYFIIPSLKLMFLLVRLTLHDRKKQRLKKKKTEISAKTPTETYFNTYRLHTENLDFMGSLSHFTTVSFFKSYVTPYFFYLYWKSSLFILKLTELEGEVSDNNCTNQGEKVIPLIQKITKRKVLLSIHYILI